MPYFLHAINTPPDSGTPYTNKARAIAQRHNGLTITYLSNPEDRESWTQRERRRLLDHIYTPLPWLDDDGMPCTRYREMANSNRGYGDSSPFDSYDCEQLQTYFIASRYHFAHVSLQSDAMIAYTPSDEHGLADRQVRIRCGRYLDLVAPWLQQIDKDKLCARIRSMTSASFKLAVTPDEVRAVYRHGQGFTSCMGSHNFDQDDDTNPVSVYGNSDLALAYLGDIDSDDPRVTARCVVWPAHKLYTRIYGDELLACLLRAADYTQGDWISGAKIRAIKTPNGRYVMPYIDASEYVDLTHDGKHFTLCGNDGGEYSCRETSGRIGPQSMMCANCVAIDPRIELAARRLYAGEHDQ